MPFAAGIIFALCAALVLASALLSERLKGGEVIIPALVRLKEKISRALPIPPLFLWELKKLLINRKGLVIIAAAICFSAAPVLSHGYLAAENSVRDDYYIKYAGEVTEEKIGEMQTELDGIISECSVLDKEYKSIDGGKNPERVAFLTVRLYDLKEKRRELKAIVAEAEAAYAVTVSRGIRTELIKPDTYELLLKKDRRSTEKICLFICFCLIGVFSGSCSCEAQSNMTCVLRTLKKGRMGLLGAKLVTAAVIAPLVSAGAFSAQFILIGLNSGYNDVGASVQSIELLRHIPFEITLGGYLALIVFLRIIFAFALCVIIMFISSRCRTSISSLAVCAGVIALPAVLSATGLIPVPGVTELIGFVL